MRLCHLHSGVSHFAMRAPRRWLVRVIGESRTSHRANGVSSSRQVCEVKDLFMLEERIEHLGSHDEDCVLRFEANFRLF